MLEGLEISESKLTTLEESIRIDAEYFKKDFLLCESKLKSIPHFELSKRATFLIGPFGSSFDTEKYITNGEYRYIRGQDVKPFVLKDEDKRFLPKEDFVRLSKYRLMEQDVLVSVVGTLGNACVVQKQDIPAIFSCKSSVIRTTGINPIYLLAFLNSNFGLNQLERKERGAIQKGLNLDDLRTILVPTLSDNFQHKIETKFYHAQDILYQSKTIYSGAEHILLAELSLNNWQPSIKNNNTKTLHGSFLSSGRIDAEYYQPKYDELEYILKGKPYSRIRELKTFNARGLQPNYDTDGTLDVINSKHILESTLDYENFEKTNIENWLLQERAQVHINDILTYTTGANIGRTQTYLVDKPALASNHVNILRVEGINPVYVGFVINSIIGRLQTEKYSAGSAQLELYPKDLDEFLIPIASKETQEIIAGKVRQSFALQAKSKQLLEVAKRAVEVAIEQNETVALNYLNNI